MRLHAGYIPLRVTHYYTKRTSVPIVTSFCDISLYVGAPAILSIADTAVKNQLKN